MAQDGILNLPFISFVTIGSSILPFSQGRWMINKTNRLTGTNSISQQVIEIFVIIVHNLLSAVLKFQKLRTLNIFPKFGAKTYLEKNIDLNRFEATYTLFCVNIHLFFYRNITITGFEVLL